VAEIPEATPTTDSRPPWDVRTVCLLGTFIVVAAVLHAMISMDERSNQPLHVGTVSGDVHVRESPTRVSHQKFGGCQVECFESFVVVYVDKTKQPTWTGNYVKVIPWSKIEYMTLDEWK
tara:strand:+ start:506593 stop:506949 length:357 start_codon:yes stop_codon:yes gene_type:complete